MRRPKFMQYVRCVAGPQVASRVTNNTMARPITKLPAKPAGVQVALRLQEVIEEAVKAQGCTKRELFERALCKELVELGFLELDELVHFDVYLDDEAGNSPVQEELPVTSSAEEGAAA